MGGLIVDLFAGPGGWDEGLRSLGLTNVVGLEWDEAVCKTRAAAGHRTIRCDVAQYPTAPFVGKAWGLIASPPCPDFSTAGLRAGVDGDSGRLMLEVPRWVEALQPEWIACEQVPPALSLYEDFALRFQDLGYQTWTGVLNAADYGVPQTRKRAVLIAAHARVAPPEPTHSPAASLFGLQPWVSMAEAVGWGYDNRPAPTVTGGGTKSGGPEPFGNGARQALRRWVVDRRTNSKDGRGGLVPTVPVPMSRPAPTLTGAAGGQWVLTDGEERRKLTVAEGAVLQSFPPDYPFQGNKGQKFQQVGNAVPPRLAAAVVGALIGAESMAA